LLLALGIIGSSAYKTEEPQVLLAVGESIELKGYTVTFNGMTPDSTETMMIIIADISLSKDGRDIAELHPQQVYKTSEGGWFPKVAIRYNLVEDVYVSLDDWTDDGSAYISVTISPLIDWIWVGGVLLLIGGLVSFSARARKPTEEEDPQAALKMPVKSLKK
jgi:cytochrome c-type biogenesis protein CcmF